MPRPPGLLLLALLFGGLLAAGLRSPWLWSCAAALIWGLACAFPEALATAPGTRWGAFLLWASAAALSSSQPWNGLEPLSAWAGGAAFLLLARRLWGEGERRLWFVGLCAAGPVFFAAALWTAGRLGWETNEMTGFLPPHYNYTAFVEAAAGAAALAALGHPLLPKGRLRGLLWALAGLMTFALLLARARGAFLALVAAAALMAWRQGRLKALLRPALFAAAAAACVTAGVLAWGGAAGWLLKRDKPFKRPQLWAAALEVAAEKPLLGEGPGNFAVGFRRHKFPADEYWGRYSFSTAHAHSEPLQLLCETGVIGLALFLWALGAGLRGLAPSRETAWSEEAALGAWAAMSLHLLVDNALHRPGLMLLYFSAAACAPGPAAAAKLPSARRGLARALCVALMGFSIAAWVPRWIVYRALALAGEGLAADQRVAVLSSAIKVLPAQPDLREALARAYLGAAPPDRARALAELEAAERLEPANAWRLMMRAQLQWERGDRASAYDLAGRAVTLEPRFLAARLLRARLLADAGRGEEARAELREIRLLDALPRGPITGILYSGYDRRLSELPAAELERLERRVL